MEKLTSPNLRPQASLFPQKTQVSHKHGPSLPLHISLHALQHSMEELNLKSDPHLTAGPHSSKLSIPLQHSPLFALNKSSLPLPSINDKESTPELAELALGLIILEITAYTRANDTRPNKRRRRNVKRAGSRSFCLRPI